MARRENLLGRLPAFANEKALAPWVGFYLLAPSHTQREPESLSGPASSACLREFSPAQAEGTWLQCRAGSRLSCQVHTAV